MIFVTSVYGVDKNGLCGHFKSVFF